MAWDDVRSTKLKPDVIFVLEDVFEKAYEVFIKPKCFYGILEDVS